MSGKVAAVIAGVVLGSAGVAGATELGNALVLNDKQAVTYGGITCTAYKGTTPTNANIVCVRNNLKGYGVVVSQDAVVVARRVGGTVKVIFSKPNK